MAVAPAVEIAACENMMCLSGHEEVGFAHLSCSAKADIM